MNFQVERVKINTEAQLNAAIDRLYTPSSDNNGTQKIHQVETFKYEARTGDIIQETYLPSAYRKYYTNTQRAYRSRTNTIPYQRLGNDNKYPLFLLDLLNKSGLHKSARNAATANAYGNGLKAKGSDGPQFLEWLRTVGVTPKFVQFTLRQIASFGGAYANMFFTNQRRGELGTRKVLELGKVTPG